MNPFRQKGKRTPMLPMTVTVVVMASVIILAVVSIMPSANADSSGDQLIDVLR